MLPSLSPPCCVIRWHLSAPGGGRAGGGGWGSRNGQFCRLGPGERVGPRARHTHGQFLLTESPRAGPEPPAASLPEIQVSAPPPAGPGAQRSVPQRLQSLAPSPGARGWPLMEETDMTSEISPSGREQRGQEGEAGSAGHQAQWRHQQGLPGRAVPTRLDQRTRLPACSPPPLQVPGPAHPGSGPPSRRRHSLATTAAPGGPTSLGPIRGCGIEGDRLIQECLKNGDFFFKLGSLLYRSLCDCLFLIHF